MTGILWLGQCPISGKPDTTFDVATEVLMKVQLAESGNKADRKGAKFASNSRPNPQGGRNDGLRGEHNDS